ncbi:MAG: PEP-CTERM sorting domain-containing protein [Akkermansia sp.]
MKRTLFLIAFSFACLTSSQANTVSIDFGTSDSKTTGSVNITENDLIFKHGVSTPISTEAISLGTMQGTVRLSVAGWTGNGGVSSSAGSWCAPLEGSVPSFTGDNYASTELDGLTFLGDKNNKLVVPDLVITFTGLAAGTYSMEILSGWNGPNPMHPGLSFTLGGEGITTSGTSWASKEANDVQAGTWTSMTKLKKGATLTTELGVGVVADPKLPETEHNNKGVVANASDIIVGEGGTLTLTISGKKDDGSYNYSNCINNIKLTSNNPAIPEPTTATLSLLGFATLLLRRKRK